MNAPVEERIRADNDKVVIEIIIKKRCNCRKRPDHNSDVKRILQEGYHYIVKDEYRDSGWYYIEKCDGWIHRDNFTIFRVRMDNVSSYRPVKPWNKTDRLYFRNISDVYKFFDSNPSSHWVKYYVINDAIVLTIALFELEYWNGFHLIKRNSINSNASDNNEHNKHYLLSIEKSENTVIESLIETISGGLGNKFRDTFKKKVDGIQYRVRVGDNLHSITSYYDISVEELFNANKDIDLRRLKSGMVLIIPNRKSKKETSNNVALTYSQKLINKTIINNLPSTKTTTDIVNWEDNLDYFDKSTHPKEWGNIETYEDRMRWTKRDTKDLTILSSITVTVIGIVMWFIQLF